MKRPNTFVIGAPKCGTTTLLSWLGQHPQAFVSPEKEPHFFYDLYGKTLPEEDYLALFSAAGDKHKVLAEGSVWYLYAGVAAEILEYNPQARFVVCLRNPVDMALSLHAQTLVNRVAYEATTRFEDAWALSEQRLAGQGAGLYRSSWNTALWAYKHSCRVGTQLEALFNAVPRELVHVIVLEDLRDHSRATWDQLLSFLSLDPFDEVAFTLQNRAARPRSMRLHQVMVNLGRLKKSLGIGRSFGLFAGLYGKNVIEADYRRPDDAFIREMEAEFAPEVDTLERLLGRDLSCWRTHRYTQGAAKEST